MKPDHDFLIVGAGVIGSSTGYYLKKLLPEAEVTIIDMNNRPGAGNTSKSAALYRNIFSSSTSQALAGSSIAYYNNIVKEGSVVNKSSGIQLNPIGYLWLFSRQQWQTTIEARSKLQMERDGMDILDIKDIKEIYEISSEKGEQLPGIHRGIHGHSCGSLSGMGLAEHYSTMFRELGGSCIFNTRMNSLDIAGEEQGYAPWSHVRINGVIEDDGTRHDAKNVVMCTGAWTHDLLVDAGIAPNVFPKKRQLFGLKLNSMEQINGPGTMDPLPAVILPAGGVYLKPIPEKDFLVVGCADDLGQPYSMDDPKPDIDYFEKAIRPVLDHYFPALEYSVITQWAGYYSYHWPDKNPVIESVANLTWITGTSGSGIMKADAIGRIGAAKLAGLEYAELANGIRFRVSDLSLRERSVENEFFII